MMRRSRRKTLSHSEIENFLTDIDHIGNGLVQSENVKPHRLSPLEVKKKKRSSIVEEVKEALLQNDRVEQPTPKKSYTEAELVRQYCKMCFNNQSNMDIQKSSQAKIKIARQLYEQSNYKLITSRIMIPETFAYPIHSNEAKKSLLMNLSEIFSEAEKQRKEDVDSCEQFTRCKSLKAKGKNSNYSYVDIDTNEVINYSDYEKRYLLYVERTKTSYQLARDVKKALFVPKSKPLRLNDSEIGNKNKRKFDQCSRRGTLSPATLRSMIEEECNADGDKSDLSANQAEVLVSELDSILKEEKPDFQSHDLCEEGVLSSTVDMIQSDSKLVVNDENSENRAETFKSPVASFSSEFGRKSNLKQLLSQAMDMLSANEDNIDDDETFQLLERLVANRLMQKRENSNSDEDAKLDPVEDVIDDEELTVIDETAAEQSAQRKLAERIEIANNKYKWDIVSVQAVNRAITIKRSKKC